MNDKALKDAGTEENGKPVVDMIGIPEFDNSSLFACADGGIPFRPDQVFDVFKVPDDKRYTFKIRPMKPAERDALDHDLNRVTSIVMLWAAKNGIKVSDLSEENLEKRRKAKKLCDLPEKRLAYYQEFQRHEDTELKNKVIRSCIIGLDGYTDGAGNPVSFDHDDTGAMSQKQYDGLNKYIIAALYKKLRDISNVRIEELLGL